MKKLLLFVAIFCTHLAIAANFYWVGGSGNWSDYSTHWATSSGGSSFHGNAPTSSDNVYFDANSFTAASQSVTADVATINCNDMNWTGVTNSPTLNMNSKLLYIYGSLTLVSGMSTSNFYCCTNSTTFKATTTGKTITTAGKSIGQVWFDGAGGEWTLQDALNAPGGVFLLAGDFITNNQTLDIYYFNSQGTTARSMNLGSSTVNITYTSPPWTVSGSNYTFTCGTSTINIVNNGTFTGGGKTYYNVNFSGTTNTISNNNTFNNVSFTNAGTIGGTNVFNNVSFGGDATITGSQTFNDLAFGASTINTLTAGTTQTINGTLSVPGTCSSFASIISSSTSTAAISKSSGSVTLNYVGLSDITASGGASFTATNAVATGTNTGWSISNKSSLNLYWVGGTGNWGDASHWSLTSGGASSGCLPTPADNVLFDANSFSGSGQTVTVNVSRITFNNMDWTGVTNNPTFDVNNKLVYVYGSFTLAAAMTASNFYGTTYGLRFLATTTGKTITTAGKSVGQIWFTGVGGEWTLQDAVTAPGGIWLVDGSLITNNQTLNIYYFASNYSSTRSLNLGSSVINITYASPPWQIGATGLTFNAGTSTININANGTFTGGGLTYYDVNFAGASSNTLSSNNSFHNVSFTNGAVINGINSFNNLTLSGTSTFGSGTKTVNGLFTLSGSLTTTSGSLSLGASASAIFNATATLTISGSTTVDFNSRPVTFKSTSGGTAKLAQISGTLSNATNVTVERYVSSQGRRWRFLSSPCASTTLADWQGEIHLTGNGTPGTTGFDDNGDNTAASNSVYTYDETVTSGSLDNGWTGATANTNPITVGKGFRVFVRGTRVPGRLNGGISTQDEVTLNLTGTLNTGNTNMNPTFTSSGTLANDGWNFMGNPYACGYDWNAFHDAGRSGSDPDYSGTDYAHFDPTIYVFDGTSNSYKSYNAVTNSGTLTSGIIPSGAAFFVKAVASSPTMTFKESYKSATAPLALHKSGEQNELHMRFHAESNDYDEFIFKIAEGSSFNKDVFDIAKLSGNPSVNLSSFGSDNVPLSLSAFPEIKEGDILKLNTTANAEGNYWFEFSGLDNFMPTIGVFLNDKYTNTLTDIRKTTRYDFAISANSGTFGNKRFELVFGKTATDVEELLNAQKEIIFGIYPNPVKDVLNIYLSKNASEFSWVILDVSGKTIKAGSILTQSATIDISEFAAGTYFIEVKTTDKIQTQRFVK